MCEILKGAPVAAAIKEKCAEKIAALAKSGVTPTLAVIRIGDDPAAMSYERGIFKRCTELGLQPRQELLPADVSQRALLAVIDGLNTDPTVHGILMFRPLPKQLDEREACEAILPEKDVDGAGTISLGGLVTGLKRGYPPCCPHAAIEILKYYGVPLEGADVTVLGRSLVVGRPLALLLVQKNATVTVCHTKTRGLRELTQKSDIVISAMGKGEMLDASYFREGQTVIDIGVSWVEKKQKLCGDVDEVSAAERVAALTPVPGGVGTVCNAILLWHVVQAAEAAARKKR